MANHRTDGGVTTSDEDRPPAAAREDWPPLPFAGWRETQATLHMWTQIVGKVKLALCPFLNEWWQVAFQVTPRGLTTGPIPAPHGVFAVDFDFVEHALYVRGSDGRAETLPLVPRSVADFYRELMASLPTLGVDVAINSLPAEVPNPVAFDRDEGHAAYDPAAVHRWWHILAQTERVLQRYRAPFVGKSSPVLFFWGGFDLTATRFSGRPAVPPAGVPRFMRLAEEQENVGCGFWPGNPAVSGVTLGEPAFYSYIYPAPAGFPEAPIAPEGAFYHAQLGEFIYPYAAARRTAAPEEAVLAFFRSAYAAAANLAGWDRRRLEREDLPEVARAITPRTDPIQLET